MDLSKLSDADLMALKNGDLSKVSDEGLTHLSGERKTPLKIGKEGFSDALSQTLKENPIGATLAAFGSPVRDLIESGKQALGMEDEQAIKANRQIAGEHPVAALAGNVATYAPLALVPGANTVAGGAILGGLTGAAQPVVGDESRLSNAALGTLGGVAIPALVKTGKVAKALVSPFTESGRESIATNLIKRAAANPESVLSNLGRSGATQGFDPTVGQVANDAGVAALERTIRAIDPRGFDSVDKSQRQALADALRSVAGTPEARQAAITVREEAVKPLYDVAKNAAVNADNEFLQLMGRPSMKSAQSNAVNLASERGAQFSPNGKLTGQSLHDIKMGLDDAIGGTMNGLQGAQRNAALATKEQYINWLEGKIPEYATAKQTYTDLSKPINQMDIGQNLLEKFVPAIYRDMESPASLNSSALAKAIMDNGDDIARNVTGMKSATLKNTMSPEQMQKLNGVLSDVQMMKAMEQAGRGVGSDTIQKASMSNLAAEAGVPNWLSNIARVPGGMLKRVGDLAYGNADEQIRMRLAELLRNPKEAAAVMRKSGVSPSRLAEALRNGSQGLALSATPYLAGSE